jgi:lipid A ethanolaminephosphotransferase
VKEAVSFRTIKSHWLVLGLALYFTFTLNMSLWRSVSELIELTNGVMWLFAFSIPCVLLAIFLFIFTLIVIPWFGKPLIAMLLLLSAITNYFMFTLGIQFDVDMIRNIFETNVREASDFLTWGNFFWIFLSGILPVCLLIAVKIRYHSFKREISIRLLLIIISVSVIGGSVAALSKEYAPFLRNNGSIIRKQVNPFNYIRASTKYFQGLSFAQREFIWLDREPRLKLRQDEKNEILIFILGEAARAANFSLHEYARKTNPLLSQQDIIYFKNTTACGTATATSVPCIFSHQGRKKFDVVDAKITQNLLDIIHAAGYDVLWLENDNGCKGVCNRVPTEDMVKIGNPEFCERNFCRDEVFLPRLNEKLKNITGNTAIFLHAMGSHGPSYYQRYPEKFRKFTPTCDTSSIQNCSNEAIVNTYDNTILYTDYIISSIIDNAKEFSDMNVGVMYVSDHGESLGEHGIYLHGFPFSIAPKEQTHIPFLFWMSETTQKDENIDLACLKTKAAHDSFTHDHIFHSVLSFLGVKTTIFRSELDIFHGCREE